MAVLLSLTLIFLNFIIFGSGSHLLSTAGTEVSIPLLQAILIRSITLMGVPLLFIWIGFRFGENHEGLLPPLQAWIFTVINGAIILFIFFRFTNGAGPGLIYDVFLPILRDVFPALLGLLIGMCLNSLIEKLFSAYTGQIFKNIYWIVLISSALFSHDLFSLNYETGVWGALLFFETGNYLRHYGVPTIKKSVIYFCLGFLGEIILNCSMSYISAIVHLNLSSSLRFVNGVNPFMIIAIIALFSIIMQLSHAKVFSDRQGLLNLYLLASGLFG